MTSEHNSDVVKQITKEIGGSMYSEHEIQGEEFFKSSFSEYIFRDHFTLYKWAYRPIGEP